MESGNILVVDDESDIREILMFNLENVGYNVDCAASPKEAFAKLTPRHDLILLDVMMEGMSGFKVAEILRKEKENMIPIIFLTAKTTEKDKLTGFDAGGDDYITKPFSINEVLARVKAVLKRSATTIEHAEGSDEIHTGKIHINVPKKLVFVDGEPIKLSKKEFEVLCLLADNTGKIFSRAELISKLWQDAPYVLERTVDVHIARIRNKLGECKTYITNRSGYGYCFSPAGEP